MTFITELRNINVKNDKGERNQNTGIVGRSGIGKSYAGLRISELYHNTYLDVPFTVENIVFTPNDFIKQILALPRYSCLMFDDAGVKYASRDWWSDINKTLNKVLQSFRYRLINIFITVPDKSWIDKIAQGMLHGFIVMKQPGVGRYTQIETNPHVKNRIYHHKRNPIHFELPSQNLIDDYEKKKDIFLTAEWEKDLKRLERKEAMTKPDELLLKEIENNYDAYCFNGHIDVDLMIKNLSISQRRAGLLKKLYLKEQEKK